MRLTVFAFALCVTATIATAAEFKPVAASMLEGTKLTSPEQKFSLEGPAGWHWWSAPGPEGKPMYVCRRGATEGSPFLVSAIVETNRSHPTVSEMEVQSFVEGLIRSSKRAGETDFSSAHKPSSRPFPTSYRVTLASTTAKGEHQHLYAYIGFRKLFYSIQTTIADNDPKHDDELEEFEKFVASFRSL
jgi:hypothetical protein